MEKNYEHEEDLDILYVHDNPSREKPIGNIIFGNIVVDIGEKGKVLGIEIDCPSIFFNTERINSIFKDGDIGVYSLVSPNPKQTPSFRMKYKFEGFGDIPIDQLENLRNANIKIMSVLNNK